MRDHYSLKRDITVSISAYCTQTYPILFFRQIKYRIYTTFPDFVIHLFHSQIPHKFKLDLLNILFHENNTIANAKFS